MIGHSKAENIQFYAYCCTCVVDYKLGPPPTATNGGRRRIAPSQYEDTEEYNDNGASAFAAKPSRPPSYASLMEAEALEEAEAAIEAIVRPLKQPVELLPRAAEVSGSEGQSISLVVLAP